jgi:hypothetical protein
MRGRAGMPGDPASQSAGSGLRPTLTPEPHLCGPVTLRRPNNSARMNDSSDSAHSCTGETRVSKAASLNLASGGKESGFHEFTQAEEPELCPRLPVWPRDSRFVARSKSRQTGLTAADPVKPAESAARKSGTAPRGTGSGAESTANPSRRATGEPLRDCAAGGPHPAAAATERPAPAV